MALFKIAKPQLIKILKVGGQEKKRKEVRKMYFTLTGYN